MKLNIDTAELSYLLYHLGAFASQNPKRFKMIATANKQPLPAAVTIWMAKTLEDYSLCALTPDEFIEAINSGDRCIPEL